ncbi:manganese efflux pump MntP family protein [Olsenella intestinalis]|uniref:manganese efflux pump MntP n=1 Tax=Olsenella intestinalis TaxID=2930083 RepID=UPI00200C4260|nr:manganese efflux pump MntP family protein [Olsenella intestinalis]
MGVIEILLLGLALSADAFAVTVSNSFAYAHEPRARLALMPVFFGAFQALMPLLGYFLGGLAAELIERYSGIVTMVILGIIGANMVREGVQALRASKAEGSADASDPAGDSDHADAAAGEKSPKRLTLAILVLQAIATAIDAFAVGVSLRAQDVNLPFAVCVIGLTTFVCCVVALLAGKRLGSLLGDRAEVAGGLVLIGIGIKALLG